MEYWFYIYSGKRSMNVNKNFQNFAKKISFKEYWFYIYSGNCNMNVNKNFQHFAKNLKYCNHNF